MGQYYRAIILSDENSDKKETIRFCLVSYNYENGAKLMEHSYIGNLFVETFESLLIPGGIAYMSRPVWAGDYAAPELDDNRNLYSISAEMDIPSPSAEIKIEDYSYVVNHSVKQYVDKRKQRADQYGYRIHPLPLLVAEGNGQGGGDYFGTNENMVGIWARNVISLEKEAPEGYGELNVEFCCSNY